MSYIFGMREKYGRTATHVAEFVTERQSNPCQLSFQLLRSLQDPPRKPQTNSCTSYPYARTIRTDLSRVETDATSRGSRRGLQQLEGQYSSADRIQHIRGDVETILCTSLTLTASELLLPKLRDISAVAPDTCRMSSAGAAVIASKEDDAK